MKLTVSAPLNNLSFGNVSYNILRELYKKKVDVSFFPIGEIDISAFDKIDQDFVAWINNCANYRYHTIDKNTPTLSLWHLNGSEKWIGRQNHLLTFYELDQPTFIEKKIIDIQNSVFLTSEYSKTVFNNLGCDNIHKINLGFDTDFHKIEKRLVKDKTHFILMGKFEKRKHTKDIIKLWLKKYGNNNRFLLTCCVDNPFFNGNLDMKKIIENLLEGKHYSNINFLPHLKTNTEVNHLLNSADIDLTGLSGAEGWNLPAFNATALGKWSIVYNHTGHCSWATKDNCVLLEAEEKEPAYDGFFFNEGSTYNQGNIYKFNEDQASQAMDKAVSVCQNVNVEGEKLTQTHTYEKTVESILSVIKTHNEVNKV